MNLVLECIAFENSVNSSRMMGERSSLSWKNFEINGGQKLDIGTGVWVSYEVIFCIGLFENIVLLGGILGFWAIDRRHRTERAVCAIRHGDNEKLGRLANILRVNFSASLYGCRYW